MDGVWSQFDRAELVFHLFWGDGFNFGRLCRSNRGWLERTERISQSWDTLMKVKIYNTSQYLQLTSKGIWEKQSAQRSRTTEDVEEKPEGTEHWWINCSDVSSCWETLKHQCSKISLQITVHNKADRQIGHCKTTDAPQPVRTRCNMDSSKSIIK